MTEVKVEILQDSDGERPKIGQTVTVHYVGTLQDGKKFDSSRDRNRPLKFILGKREVIEGWEIGVAQMKVGQRAKLTCPPKYGYGERGVPGVIFSFDI